MGIEVLEGKDFSEKFMNIQERIVGITQDYVVDGNKEESDKGDFEKIPENSTVNIWVLIEECMNSADCIIKTTGNNPKFLRILDVVKREYEANWFDDIVDECDLLKELCEEYEQKCPAIMKIKYNITTLKYDADFVYRDSLKEYIDEYDELDAVCLCKQWRETILNQ